MKNSISDLIGIATSLNEYDEQANSATPNQNLVALQKSIVTIQQPVVRRLQEVMTSMEGSEFSEDEKRSIVGKLLMIFRGLGVGVVCPKTGIVGKLTLKRAGRDKRLVFEVRVTEEGNRTSHFSSTNFPHLVVAPFNSAEEELE